MRVSKKGTIIDSQISKHLIRGLIGEFHIDKWYRRSHMLWSLFPFHEPDSGERRCVMEALSDMQALSNMQALFDT